MSFSDAAGDMMSDDDEDFVLNHIKIQDLHKWNSNLCAFEKFKVYKMLQLCQKCSLLTRYLLMCK